MLFLRSLMVLVVLLVVSAPGAVVAQEHGHDTTTESSDGHGGEHGSTSNADPLSFDPDLAIATLVVFLLLFAVLSKFAWGPITKALDSREKAIADAILAAQQSEEEGRRLLAAYDAKLAAAQDEVRAILDEARRDAEHTQQEILAKARADAQTEMERAKREIETARDQALSELATSAANHAVELAGKVLRRKLDPAEQAALVEEAMAGMPSHSRN